MESKECRICEKNLPIENFYLRKDSGSRRTECNSCRSSKLRLWKKEKDFDRKQYQKHRDKKLASVKSYRENPANKENIRKSKKQWLDKKLKSDPLFKVVRNLRRRTLLALHGKNKSKATLELIGCSLDDLKTHLESLWQEEMTWENYGSFGWVIDHIRPLASFDLHNKGEQLVAFNYKNLQPLWYMDNLMKGDKWDC